MQVVTDLITNRSALSLLQQRFAICELKGEFYVVDLCRVRSSDYDLDLYKREAANMAIRRFIETLPMDADVAHTIKQFWNSPSTKVYDEIAFSPTPTKSTTLNLWIEPNAKPVIGSPPTLILEHIQQIICNGDQEKYDYLVKFLAHMLQKPEEKPGVMPVLVGKQGSGKGMFFTLIRRIWSRSSFMTSNVEDVAGKFNSVLERTFVVMLDEALFSGDKKSTDRMKSLITEEVISIEAKYQPPRQAESFHRYFATTNHKHFANIEVGDRRHLFFFTSDKMIGNWDYFDRLNNALNSEDEIGRLVNYLLGVDLADFRPWRLPRDLDKQDQLLRSLTGFDEYLYSMLRAETQLGGFGNAWEGPFFVTTFNIEADFTGFLKGRSQARFNTTQAMLSRLRDLCPSSKSGRRKTNEKISRGFHVPDLDTARDEFCKALGVSVDWEN